MTEQLVLFDSKLKKLGFQSEIIGKSRDAIFSNKSFYYLWLCELDKWLRENTSYELEIIPGWTKGKRVYLATIWEGADDSRDVVLPVVEEHKGFTITHSETYQETLEIGILAILELL